MTERKGITVMTLGIIIGIILFVAFIAIVIAFYESDLFTGFLDGLRSAIQSFMPV